MMKVESVSALGERDVSLNEISRDRVTVGGWATLFVLTLVYALNVADRYVLSTLIEPIKNEFGLSDSAVGFLTGTSLGIFYVFAGLPLGALADRVNRKRIIVASISVWSAMTALCGLSSTFIQLFMARVGVGIGEAGGVPASHSIVSDRFTPRYRAFALSVVGLGASIGAWLGAEGAGMLNDAFGWRHTLVIFGLMGIPLLLLVWSLVKEPLRGAKDLNAHPTMSDSDYTLMATIRYTMKNKPLLHVMGGGTMATLWGWGIIWWAPSFLIRSYDLTVSTAGGMLGPMHGVGGTALMIVTVLAMYMLRNKPLASQPMFVFWATILGTFASIWTFMAKDLQEVRLALWFFVPLAYVFIGPTMGLVQNLYPPRMRAKGIAILLFTANIITMAGAPQIIGLCSDIVASRIANPQESLKYCLLGCSFLGFWAAYHFLAAAWHLKKQGGM